MSVATCVLVILDGWGHSDKTEYNALLTAHTPTWDRLMTHAPHRLLSTSGAAVGLPDGQMGNSEVGHTTIGAGRVVHQSLVTINRDIESGAFADNKQLVAMVAHCQRANSAFHLIGLVSDGGVHSHLLHIETVCAVVARFGVTLRVHVITDGRDTAPQSAQRYIDSLERVLAPFGDAHIATVTGRYYAMDRDNNHDRTDAAYNAIVKAQASWHAIDARTAVNAAYERGESDEFIQPTVIGEAASMQANDCCLHLNFRADRARQLIVRLLEEAATQDTLLSNMRTKTQLATLTEYNADFSVSVLYPPTVINNHLGEWLAKHGKRQLRIAETEKYAHVTFFFNGGVEPPYDLEERVLIPSLKVATYDLAPAMKARGITEVLTEAIGKHDCIICNFANGDMVGHTGNFPATVKAAEIIDSCLADILVAIDSVGGDCFITADHGNAECMWDANTQQPHTAHTTNPVPFVHYSAHAATALRCDGVASLADIAPTVLACMSLTPPQEMTGKSLLIK